MQIFVKRELQAENMTTPSTTYSQFHDIHIGFISIHITYDDKRRCVGLSNKTVTQISSLYIKTPSSKEVHFYLIKVYL